MEGEVALNDQFKGGRNSAISDISTEKSNQTILINLQSLFDIEKVIRQLILDHSTTNEGLTEGSIWNNFSDPKMTTIYKFQKNAAGYYKNISLLADSKQALNQMKDRKQNIILFSSLHSKSESAVRDIIEWTIKNLGNEWKNKLVFSEDPSIINASYFITDKLPKRGVFQNPWELILFRRPFRKISFSGKSMNSWIQFPNSLNTAIKSYSPSKSMSSSKSYPTRNSLSENMRNLNINRNNHSAPQSFHKPYLMFQNPGDDLKREFKAAGILPYCIVNGEQKQVKALLLCEARKTEGGESWLHFGGKREQGEIEPHGKSIFILNCKETALREFDEETAKIFQAQLSEIKTKIEKPECPKLYWSRGKFIAYDTSLPEKFSQSKFKWHEKQRGIAWLNMFQMVDAIFQRRDMIVGSDRITFARFFADMIRIPTVGNFLKRL